MTVVETSSLQQKLEEAIAEHQAIHRRLSLKKEEFEAKKSSCTGSEFTTLKSTVEQLECKCVAQLQAVLQLEKEYGQVVDRECREFTRHDLIKQRTELEAELNDIQQEIALAKAQITSAQERIGTLENMRNCRILPRLNSLPRSDV